MTNKIVYNNQQHIAKFNDGIAAEYIPNYVTPILQNELFKFLFSSQPFTRVSYEKLAALRFTPQMSWCYGQYNEESIANYRGQSFKTKPIPQRLLDIKALIEQYRGVDFNAIIINKYENGEDHIG